MHERKIIFGFLIFIIIILNIIHNNYIFNNSYDYYLKANNLKNTTANYQKFCEDNKILMLD